MKTVLSSNSILPPSHTHGHTTSSLTYTWSHTLLPHTHMVTHPPPSLTHGHTTSSLTQLVTVFFLPQNLYTPPLTHLVASTPFLNHPRLYYIPYDTPSSLTYYYFLTPQTSSHLITRQKPSQPCYSITLFLLISLPYVSSPSHNTHTHTHTSSYSRASTAILRPHSYVSGWTLVLSSTSM